MACAKSEAMKNRFRSSSGPRSLREPRRKDGFRAIAFAEIFKVVGGSLNPDFAH